MNSEITELEDTFFLLRNNELAFFEGEIRKIYSECFNSMISKRPIFNIRPFENELVGMKLGKVLKKEPLNFKGIYKYYLDTLGRVRLVEKFVGTKGQLIDTGLYFYEPDRIVSYHFESERIRNIKVSIVHDGIFVKDINYGGSGLSISDYKYEKDLLTVIDVFQKSHKKTEGSTYKIVFEYSNQKLISIVYKHPNGYQEQRYSAS